MPFQLPSSIPVSNPRSYFSGDPNDRLKLFLLICCNCGYTQIDINDLTHDQVDLVGGYIERPRSKTKDLPDTPVVKYKLWSETLRLLKAHATPKKAGRVLVNNNGKALVQTRIEGGRLRRADNVRDEYEYVARQLGKLGPIKLIRKTSASLIASNPAFARYAQYFLGKAARNDTDNSYVEPSQTEFEKTLDWLGSQYPFSVRVTPR